MTPADSTFYLPRTLLSNGKVYSESDLLGTSKYIVVLAEPGAGKSRLMESLAVKLNTSNITANVFCHMDTDGKNTPLVIDAFDELARIDQSGIHKLLARAKKAKPTHIIISSRSSEWDEATTHSFKGFFGREPTVVRLAEFNYSEQQKIFENHAPGENFTAFIDEVDRFDLNALLPNPQFLKLFADAYVESERHFTDKSSIFEQAIERLAKEVNTSVVQSRVSLSTNQKVDIASEVFAKLLLSGAEGVSTSEASQDRMYPLLNSLFINSTQAEEILATRLFKPGDHANQHRPAHKIVTEYCAAVYLTKRIANPSDPLTFSKCLPIIAPNSIVRDELRGLLGWMATLGSKTIEEATIELDPYAVLANGDPSQLGQSSKRLLLNKLKDIEKNDPYFRREDFWRRFSVTGFFTQDVVEEIKPILITGGNGHLRDLLLEILVGSPAIEQLKRELNQLALAPNESERTRIMASRCLADSRNNKYHTDIAVLMFEASNISLQMIGEVIETMGPEIFEPKFLVDYFLICANLYPNHNEHHENVIGSRYFIKRLIRCIDLETITYLLNKLTVSLTCSCKRSIYNCECLYGISKIIGSMLDQYFELASSPYDPKLIWEWIKNLKFEGHINTNQSTAVKTLREDHKLRQGIIAHVFKRMTNRDEIDLTHKRNFGWRSHFGLYFQADDYTYIVDLAFEADNTELWASHIATHPLYQTRENMGPYELRRHMRKQAHKKPTFMREWAKSNRAQDILEQESRKHYSKSKRAGKRYNQQEKDRIAKNIEYIQENRALIERGEHWGFLVHFSKLTLHEPKKIKDQVGDEDLVRTALRNCLNFITPNVPNLLELAKLKCSSQYRHSQTILYASCLEILRTNRNLEKVSIDLLHALKTNVNMHYHAVSDEDRKALEAEVDRLIFPDKISAENFLRQYVEPQLSFTGCENAQVWLLQRNEAFQHLRAELSIEWLKRFPKLPIGILDTLFETAAQYGDINELRKIIACNCLEFISCYPTPTDLEYIEERRKFWLLRGFYFLSSTPEIYSRWLKSDKDIIRLFCNRSGKINIHDYTYWPKLTSIKIEIILDAYINKWEKVDLPDHYGTESPIEEQAYRFLSEILWSIDSDDPNNAIPVLNRLICDPRFQDFIKDLKSILARQVRQKALSDFEPPIPKEIVDQLDCDAVVTVEGLRQTIIHELQDFQKAIDGGEFNSADRFYEKGERLNEVKSTEIIAERLSLRLEQQGISITPEHQLKNTNRSDFTATKLIRGKRRLLVTEVKGQWHKELYHAASTQLHERYSIHPDAEQQGIYLVIWFGSDELVAERKIHGVKDASELKEKIEQTLPPELKGLIDIFVLDVSKKTS